MQCGEPVPTSAGHCKSPRARLCAEVRQKMLAGCMVRLWMHQCLQYLIYRAREGPHSVSTNEYFDVTIKIDLIPSIYWKLKINFVLFVGKTWNRISQQTLFIFFTHEFTKYSWSQETWGFFLLLTRDETFAEKLGCWTIQIVLVGNFISFTNSMSNHRASHKINLTIFLRIFNEHLHVKFDLL